MRNLQQVSQLPGNLLKKVASKKLKLKAALGIPARA